MPWGFFSPLHIASLLFVVVFIVGLHFLLRRRSRKTQTVVLGIISFMGIVSIVYHLVFKDCPYEHLPLHLCSLTAMVLPFVVFTKSKTWGNVLLVWCFEAKKMPYKPDPSGKDNAPPLKVVAHDFVQDHLIYVMLLAVVFALYTRDFFWLALNAAMAMRMLL